MIRLFARVAIVAGSFGAILALPAGSLGAQEKPKEDRNAVPSTAIPPKGMCRLWLKDVAAAQQPAATDCATAIKSRPQNAMIIFGDLSGGDPFYPGRTTRSSINSNNTSAWPREWARDPIAYRTPTTSVDPAASARNRAVNPPTAATVPGVQTIRTTQSAVVAQPATPPPTKPPEKPQY